MLKLPQLVYVASISARVPNLKTSASILYMCFMREDTHNDNNREETEPILLQLSRRYVYVR